MQSAFPKLLFVQNRMKIERLIEEGLLLGRKAKEGVDGEDVPDDESLHMHGRAMRLDAEGESSTAEEEEADGVRKRNRLQEELKDSRRSSLLVELRRQGGVFFDDPVVDEDGDGDTESEIEEWVSAVGDGVGNGEGEHEKMT